MTKFTLEDEALEADDQDVDESDYEDSPSSDSDNIDTESDDVDEAEEEPKRAEVVKPAEADKTPVPASPTTQKVVEGEEYKVLYRKFRPRKFADLVGQDESARGLRSAVINNTVANVYLFTGERGCGKTTTARIFASALNCPYSKGDGEPCGVCDLCVNVWAGNGAEGVTEIDAASNSSVDDARRLINETQFAHGSKKNVYIIDEVHLLSKQANGTLLKTFEEPPPNVVFILCTTNPERLEAAIRSRATKYSFHLLNDSLMESLIKEVAEGANISLTEQQVSGVVYKGKGSPRDALAALEALSHNTDATFAYENHGSSITKAIVKKDVAKVVVATAAAIENGLSINEVSSTLLSYWRSMLLAVNAPELVKLTDAEFDVVVDMAEQVGTDKLIHMMRKLGESHALFSQSDPRVLLETTLIQFVVPHTNNAALRDITERADEILDSIEELKKRPAASPFESSSKPEASSWPDDSAKKEPKQRETIAPNANAVVEEKEVAKEESSADAPEIISDPDDLIDAIFEAASNKLALAIPELEVDTKKTVRNLLVLRSHKRITDEQFEMLENAVAQVDPREFDLDES